MTKELTVTQGGNNGIAPFSDIKSFEDAQRMAKALAASDLVPQAFRENVGNTLLALELSNRLDLPVFSVLQNCHIIHGKPSFSATMQIAMINKSGKFDRPLLFEFGKNNTECTAWTEMQGDRIEGPTVSMDMARAEGWLGKNGSKWKTMPEVMLRYRAATFFAKIYAAELLMGIPSSEELYDAGPSIAKEPANLDDAIQSSGDDAPQNSSSLADLAQGQDTGNTILCPSWGEPETESESEEQPQTGGVKFEGF